jgi:hypothetical protein
MSKNIQDREARLPSDVAVRVFIGDEQYRAFSLNVSANGACLTGTGRLQVGEQVIIRYLHLSIRARVAWSSDLATGVQFLEPLEPAGF